MKKQERRREDSGNQWLEVMCHLLKGGALAGIVTILSLLACAVLISMGALRERWMEGAVLAVCVLGSLAGGLYAMRKTGGRSILAGPGTGVVLFLLLLTAGFLIYDTTSVERGGAGILCACLCGGAISGMLGRKPKKKQRRGAK